MTIAKVLAAVAVALLAVLSSESAQATVLTFGANYEFSGATAPAGSPPWFTVEFDDNNVAGSVIFTLTATNLTGAENVLSLYLNVDPALYGALPLSFSGLTKTGSFDTPMIAQAVDGYKADGDGFYDLLLSFSAGGNVNKTFTQGDVLDYTISGPGLVATSFNFLSTPAGGHGPFYLASHIQNTGGGEQSGWVTDAPEPATGTLLWLGFSGLIGARFLRRRRRRALHGRPRTGDPCRQCQFT